MKGNCTIRPKWSPIYTDLVSFCVHLICETVPHFCVESILESTPLVYILHPSV